MRHIISLIMASSIFGTAHAIEIYDEDQNPSVSRSFEQVVIRQQSAESTSDHPEMIPSMRVMASNIQPTQNIPYVSVQCGTPRQVNTYSDHISLRCGSGSTFYIYPYDGQPRSEIPTGRFTGTVLFYGNLFNAVYETPQGARILPTDRECFTSSFNFQNMRSSHECELIWENRRRSFAETVFRAIDNGHRLSFRALRPDPDHPLVVKSYAISN